MYRPALYTSPIDLPEGQSGSVSVKHRIIPAGEQVSVIGMRQAFLRGLRPAAVELTSPRRIHELREEKFGMWMTDLPEELNQIGEALREFQPSGHVLVGGLGLGIVAQSLTEGSGMLSVTVIERSPSIIELCARSSYQTIQDEILEYLQTHEKPYDCYMLDTWQGTSESTWWDDVMPLRRVIRQRWGRKPRLHCWAEDIMWGQVTTALANPDNRVWRYEGLPPMSLTEARRFVRNVGFPTWERRYGSIVDTYASGS